MVGSDDSFIFFNMIPDFRDIGYFLGVYFTVLKKKSSLGLCGPVQ